MTSGAESPAGESIPPEGLPAALFRHAAERPGEPFLFVREGWNWRWSTFAELADLVSSWASDPPPDAGLPLSDLPLPRAIALDLAGLASRTAGTAGTTEPALLAAAQALRSALPAARGRDVAVLAAPLAGPARLLLAWAVLTGAALVLEPEPAALAATAAWARPTVFFGAAAAVAALRARVPPEPLLARLACRLRPRRRPALPFGRLGALVVSGPPLPEGEAAFWSARGVALLPAPVV
jgi:hypothetical protein